MDSLTDLIPVLEHPISVVSLVVLLGLMVITGRLVSRKVHEDRVQDWKDLAQHWQRIAETQQEANEQNTVAIKELLEHARTTSQVLKSLQDLRLYDASPAARGQDDPQ